MQNVETAELNTSSRKELWIVLLLCLFASFAVIYFPITHYDIHDSATGGEDGDVVQYIKIYRGVPLEEIRRPFRYRILTPYLARFVPFLPESLSKFYEITPSKMVNFKFGVVNFLALTLTSFVLYLFCRILEFSKLESLVGSYLFLTSFHVVNFAGLPHVDPLAHFFIVAGAICVLLRRYLLLLIVFFIGMFAKETTAILLLLILFLKDDRSSKIKKLVACLPGLLGYISFRFFLYPDESPSSPSLAWTIQVFRHLLRPGSHWTWLGIQVFISFGVLWALAAHGFILIKKERDHPIFRLSFLIPVVLVVPFLTGTNVARIWFLAFPAVIPLSMLSLRSLLKLRDSPLAA